MANCLGDHHIIPQVVLLVKQTPQALFHQFCLKVLTTKFQIHKLFSQLPRGCLVCNFKQPFSVFKQHFTHFNALFHPHVFSQIFSNNNFQFLNTCTKRANQVSQKCVGVLFPQILERMDYLIFFFIVVEYGMVILKHVVMLLSLQMYKNFRKSKSKIKTQTIFPRKLGNIFLSLLQQAIGNVGSLPYYVWAASLQKKDGAHGVPKGF